MAPRFLTQALRARAAVARLTGAVVENPSKPDAFYIATPGRLPLHANEWQEALRIAVVNAPAKVWRIYWSDRPGPVGPKMESSKLLASVDASGRVVFSNPSHKPRPGHDLPPGFPYPCKSPLVGTRVAGDDFAGEVIGCARGPRGKGTYLYVGGKAVSPAKIRGATKRSAATRAKLAERWSGLDYEPAARPIRAPAQRPLGLPAPRSFTDCAPHVLAAQHGAILPPDVFAQCPEAEDAAERYAIEGEVAPRRAMKGRKVQAIRATLHRKASRPGRRGMAPSPFTGQAIPYPEAYTFGAGTPERARWRWGAGGIEPGRPRAAAAPVQTSQEALAAKLRAMLGARFGASAAPRGNPWGYGRARAHRAGRR